MSDREREKDTERERERERQRQREKDRDRDGDGDGDIETEIWLPCYVSDQNCLASIIQLSSFCHDYNPFGETLT